MKIKNLQITSPSLDLEFDISKPDCERKEFESSESGVAQAAKWLSEISARYGF